MKASPIALRTGAVALFALFALQLAWHAWLAPGSRSALALALFPLVPPLSICLHSLRRGVLVGGIVSLFYFSHGIAELLGQASHALAAAEVALTLAIIGCSYWDARGYRRQPR
jgi:uncharacterized membrane protein